MHDIQNIAFISSIKRTYWTRVISLYSRRNFFLNQSKFQLRNIQFSMLWHIRNTFQTRFSSQENCTVYRDTFATLNYTRYSNFFYPNLFKPLLSGQKKKKERKSRSTKSRRDKTILFARNGANRLEQLISIGCSKVWRGGRDRTAALQTTNGPGLSIGLLAARRLYTGVVGGCTRGSSEHGDG